MRIVPAIRDLALLAGPSSLVSRQEYREHLCRNLLLAMLAGSVGGPGATSVVAFLLMVRLSRASGAKGGVPLLSGLSFALVLGLIHSVAMWPYLLSAWVPDLMTIPGLPTFPGAEVLDAMDLMIPFLLPGALVCAMVCTLLSAGSLAPRNGSGVRFWSFRTEGNREGFPVRLLFLQLLSWLGSLVTAGAVLPGIVARPHAPLADFPGGSAGLVLLALVFTGFQIFLLVRLFLLWGARHRDAGGFMGWWPVFAVLGQACAPVVIQVLLQAGQMAALILGVDAGTAWIAWSIQAGPWLYLGGSILHTIWVIILLVFIAHPAIGEEDRA